KTPIANPRSQQRSPKSTRSRRLGNVMAGLQTGHSLFVLSHPNLNCSRLVQLFLHPRPTLPRRFLWRAGAAPVRLQTHAETIAVTLKRAKLPYPINDAPAHSR